jgi:predicted phosphodiesterase
MSSKKILIQVFSDLHLENKTKIPELIPKASYLFLAGDITRINHPSFYEFFLYCNNNWEKTFYVFGNHEFWIINSHIQKIKQQTVDFFKKNELTNIFVLDNDFVSLNDDIIVFGSTFWTKSPFITSYEAQMYIKDYHMIKIKKPNQMRAIEIIPEDINEYNFNDSMKIYDFLSSTKDKKIIIMTHFPPQRKGTFNPKFLHENSIIKNYYSHPDGTLSKFDNNSNILCWISGHTHYSYNFTSNEGIQLISNQIGYCNQEIESGLFELEYSL